MSGLSDAVRELESELSRLREELTAARARIAELEAQAQAQPRARQGRFVPIGVEGERQPFVHVKHTPGKREARVVDALQAGSFKTAYQAALALGTELSSHRGVLNAIRGLKKRGFIEERDGAVKPTAAALELRRVGDPREPVWQPREPNAAAVALGRLGGLKGGEARAASLSPEQRRASARAAAEARWRKKSPAVEPRQVAQVAQAEPVSSPPAAGFTASARGSAAVAVPVVAPAVELEPEWLSPWDPEPVAEPERGRIELPGGKTRDQHRSKRKREVRGRSLSVRSATKRDLAVGRALYPETSYWKPKTRADCANVPRPCPFVSCRFHLYLDVSKKTGSLKLNYPDIEPGEMQVSCVLDVADAGGATLERTGELMNLTRERVRQLEVRAIARLAARHLPLLTELAQVAAETASERYEEAP